MTTLSQLKTQHGFSLLEVLISMIIVSVGLIGLAALQSTAQKGEFESYQRAQALMILSDMVNRLSSNREAARCYDITDESTGNRYIGTEGTASKYYDPDTETCTSWGTADSQSRATTDLQEIESLLLGSGETLNGSSVGAMLSARGCIAYDDANDRYIVSVSWEGPSEIFVPQTDCANGEYGDEARRRTVWTVVKFGELI